MKDKTKRKLLGKKNVVSVGLGEKVVGGKGTGKRALVIGVTKKINKWELDGKDIIPEKVDGETTDVIEVGEIRLLQDRTERWRPCPAGVSIGHYQITAGTLAMFVKRNCSFYILSNNHVLANVNEGKVGDAILQPGNADGGKFPASQIATLSDFVPIAMAGADTQCPLGNSVVSVFNFLAEMFGRKTRLSAFLSAESNKVDCAIALVNAVDMRKDILGIGEVTGTAEAKVGDTVQKSGRTTAVTTGLVRQRDVTVTVQMGGGRTALFEDQLLIQGDQPFSQPGDSGSAVLNMQKQVVGLLFAGSDTVTIVNRFANVSSALNITIA